MNARITIWVVAIAATLGLSGCSGAAEEPAAAESSEVAPAPSDTGSETKLDPATVQACLDLAGPFAEANAAMLQMVSDGKLPPQEVVDMWSELVTALDSVATSASDQNVKDAAAQARDDFAALRDVMQKVYVEGDLSAAGDYAAAASGIQSSYSELLARCSPESTD